MLGQIGFQHAEVLGDVIHHSNQPFLAVVVGCLQRDDAERINAKQPGSLQRLLEAGAAFGIGGDDV